MSICSANWPAIVCPACVKKTLMLDIMGKPNSFIPAMLTGAIDFNLLIPFSVTLRLAGGHSVGRKESLLLQFLTYFSAEWNTIWYGDEAIRIEHPESAFK